MTGLDVLLLVLLACAVAALLDDEGAWSRVYRYARAEAHRRLKHEVMDPMGRAYSDMATVIALRGKCETKEWTPATAAQEVADAQRRVADAHQALIEAQRRLHEACS